MQGNSIGDEVKLTVSKWQIFRIRDPKFDVCDHLSAHEFFGGGEHFRCQVRGDDLLHERSKGERGVSAARRNIECAPFFLRLNQLDQRRRDMALDMASGELTMNLADKYGTTPGRISQIRRELVADNQRFLGSGVPTR